MDIFLCAFSFRKLTDGSDKGIVFVGQLGGDAEEMVAESIDILAVANQDTVFMDV